MEQYNSDTYFLDKEEIKNLVYGKFTKQTCSECNGKGYIWACGETGEILNDYKNEWSYKDDCENCSNLGFSINFNK